MAIEQLLRLGFQSERKDPGLVYPGPTLVPSGQTPGLLLTWRGFDLDSLSCFQYMILPRMFLGIVIRSQILQRKLTRLVTVLW